VAVDLYFLNTILVITCPKPVKLFYVQRLIDKTRVLQVRDQLASKMQAYFHIKTRQFEVAPPLICYLRITHNR
jgi:hypothetical protein